MAQPQDYVIILHMTETFNIHVTQFSESHDIPGCVIQMTTNIKEHFLNFSKYTTQITGFLLLEITPANLMEKKVIPHTLHPLPKLGLTNRWIFQIY